MEQVKIDFESISSKAKSLFDINQTGNPNVCIYIELFELPFRKNSRISFDLFDLKN